MAILGIGGGFAGLWWGWREGEREAQTKRLSLALAYLTRSMSQYTISMEEMRKSFEAASKAIAMFGVSMSDLKTKESWRNRLTRHD